MRNRSLLGLFALEELEVVKLHRQEVFDASQTEYDHLYTEKRQEVIQRKENAKAAEENEDEVSSDTDDANTGETPEESDESSEAEPTDSETADTALESFMDNHAIYGLAHESIFDKDVQAQFSKRLANKITDGYNYLKSLGIEYGPVIAKRLFKGVIETLNMTTKALVKGGVSIVKYAHGRVYSYQRQKDRIQKLREVVKLIESKETPSELYSNEKVIHKLSIGKSVDVDSNFKLALKFQQDFFNTFASNVRTNVETTKHIIQNAVHSHTTNPSGMMYERFTLPGFDRSTNEMYVPLSDNVEMFAYRNVLPGNVSFLGYIPKKKTDHDDVVDAYMNAKMFLGVADKNVTTQETIPFLSIDQLNDLLDTMEKICDFGISTERQFVKVVKTRNEIRGSMSYLLRFLLTSQDKVSLRDSMAEMISLKVRYLDNTYISGSLYITDYMTRLITIGLTYAKANVEALS